MKRLIYGFSGLLLASAVLLAGQPAQAQNTDLPTDRTSLFVGSGNCAICHESDGVALRDAQGNDLSLATHWRSTMMANAARDPYWQAKVESEVSLFPSLQAVIEDKCTTCHTPLARTQAIYDGAEGYSLAEARQNSLAMDGVSCTLCHQIQPDNLGSDQSFSGGYVIDSSRVIFGPYTEVMEGPMRTVSEYGVAFGAHMQQSELCATCHTLFTPFLDDEGNIAGTFPEQVPYFEWRSSVYAQQGTQCQDCHMPRIDDPVKIASIPPGVGTQSPFWQHIFTGGNAFMLQVLRDNGADIGVTATTEHFESKLAQTREHLHESAVDLSVETQVQDGQLAVVVEVENRAGHKFPTGFPSRRAWLHVTITNEAGETVFESGGFDAEGRLLAGEDFQPHRDVIDAPNQTQVYEAVMVDVNGQVTETLLRGARYIKDNRLPPKGFTTAAERYADMEIEGEATHDDNFNQDENGEGSGGDRVTYRVDVSGQTGKLLVEVELLYQSIKPAFAEDLFTHETPAVTRFKGYYDAADKTPETVQSVSTEVTLVTGVADAGTGPPARIALRPNYPNPFNASTVIPYALASPTGFELTIYDTQGRRIRTLASGWKAAGEYRALWDGRDDHGQGVSSGVYVVRLIAGTVARSRKLILLK